MLKIVDIFPKTRKMPKTHATIISRNKPISYCFTYVGRLTWILVKKCLSYKTLDAAKKSAILVPIATLLTLNVAL